MVILRMLCRFFFFARSKIVTGSKVQSAEGNTITPEAVTCQGPSSAKQTPPACVWFSYFSQICLASRGQITVTASSSVQNGSPYEYTDIGMWIYLLMILTLSIWQNQLWLQLSIWCDDLDGQRLVCLASIKILQTDTQYFILINLCVLWSQQSCIIHSLHNFLVITQPIGGQMTRTLKIHSNF